MSSLGLSEQNTLWDMAVFFGARLMGLVTWSDPPVYPELPGGWILVPARSLNN